MGKTSAVDEAEEEDKTMVFAGATEAGPEAGPTNSGNQNRHTPY
jgi:hypothetical protein